MGPLSYMRSVVDRNVVMRIIPLVVLCYMSRIINKYYVYRKCRVLTVSYAVQNANQCAMKD